MSHYVHDEMAYQLSMKANSIISICYSLHDVYLSSKVAWTKSTEI